MTRTIHLRAYAPIPVGHRVELTCFARPRLLGSPEPDWEEPMVRDLDTGIVYQQPWHATGSVAIEMRRLDHPLGPAPTLSVVARLEGRVTACRVLSYSTDERTALATTLVVEPLA